MGDVELEHLQGLTARLGIGAQGIGLRLIEGGGDDLVAARGQRKGGVAANASTGSSNKDGFFHMSPVLA